MNGLLLVDKKGMPPLPPGEFVAPIDPLADPRRSPYPTSHDVVQQVRRAAKQKRIGHTGTLDPMASGLVVLCLGWATRLVEYYQGHDKRYQAEIALGAETDTLDALGKIVDTAAVPALTIADIETALDAFRGSIEQTPPIYSALKQGGESVHYKARRGEEVLLASRPVTIHTLHVADYAQSGRIHLDIHCSAGTYIRSLARDLGRALGTRATLVGLRRVEAGTFHIADALTMSAIEEAAQSGRLGDHMLAAGDGLGLPTIIIDAEPAQRLGHGQSVEIANAPADAGTVAAYSTANRLLGILTHVPGEPLRWKADKWFGNQDDNTGRD